MHSINQYSLLHEYNFYADYMDIVQISGYQPFSWKISNSLTFPRLPWLGSNFELVWSDLLHRYPKGSIMDPLLLIIYMLMIYSTKSTKQIFVILPEILPLTCFWNQSTTVLHYLSGLDFSSTEIESKLIAELSKKVKSKIKTFCFMGLRNLLSSK